MQPKEKVSFPGTSWCLSWMSLLWRYHASNDVSGHVQRQIPDYLDVSSGFISYSLYLGICVPLLLGVCLVLHSKKRKMEARANLETILNVFV